MAQLGNLIPLVILFLFIGGGAYVGYQIYLWSNDLANQGRKKMEKKNVTFTKDGMKVGVKELSEEEYAAKQQSALVNTWMSSSSPNYKSKLWNKEEQARQKALADQAKKSGSKSSGVSSPSPVSRPTTQRASSSQSNLPVPRSSRQRSSSPGAFPE